MSLTKEQIERRDHASLVTRIPFEFGWLTTIRVHVPALATVVRLATEQIRETMPPSARWGRYEFDASSPILCELCRDVDGTLESVGRWYRDELHEEIRETARRALGAEVSA